MGEHKCSIDNFKGDSVDSISFSPFKTPNHHSGEQHNHRHLNASGLYSHLEASGERNVLHSYYQNPKKAIITIDARTSEILTANKQAHHLLGVEESTRSVKLSDFILSPEDQYLFSEADLDHDGELTLFSGKVMDLVTSSQKVIPVSVWARKLHAEADYRCLVVMEPVERVKGTVRFNTIGTIIKCDKNFATLFGMSNSEEAVGKTMKELIPSFEMDAESNSVQDSFLNGVKQCLTGRTIDEFIFPLSIQVNSCDNNMPEDFRKGDCLSVMYEGTVWVFNNVSGLITLMPDGTIHSCNTNFSLILFGLSQNELVGKNISLIIPSFYEDTEFLDTDSMALPPFEDDDDSNAKCGASDGRTTADSVGLDLPRPINPICRSVEPSKELPDNDVFYSPYAEGLSPCNHPLELTTSTALSESFCSTVSSIHVESPHADDRTAPESHSQQNELSASSSQQNSSKQLSCSESQDTLHSCTNSITESDLNANPYAPPGDCGRDPPQEGVACCGNVPCIDEENEYDSDVFDSDDSSRSEGPERTRDGSRLSCGPEDRVGSGIDKVDGGTVSSVRHVSENRSISPAPCRDYTCSRSVSEYGLRCHSRSAKISTPRDVRPHSDTSFQSIPEGEFFGTGHHKDGMNMAIEYVIRRVVLEDGKCIYCLWVSRDPADLKDCSPLSKTHHSHTHSERTTSSITKSEESSEQSDTSDSSMLSDSEYTAGDFGNHYSILQHFRKGAFGCVKKAYRKSDGLLVIVKFMKRSEVHKDLWVYDNKTRQTIPLEISILTSIDHPNIVKVLDVFHNDQCFQMVMEKHGSGMDLFEFIEKRRFGDEPLCSYIFRQIVSALSYLHSFSILHRDIKDENVIINEKFHVKLIDFGSAAYMTDELFKTFCGTMEYCSPEVIRGNKYRGPELEMFSTGITLYTLIFRENPFIGADEILKGKYEIPYDVTEELEDLIAHLLEPDPTKRCTLAELEKNSWINQKVCVEDYKFDVVLRGRVSDLDTARYLEEVDNDFESSSSDSEVSYAMARFAEANLA